MSTSGSVDYSVTRNNIIYDALELIGAYDPGETPSNEDIASSARTLNMLIKTWQVENIGLWKNKEHILFQSYEGYEYDLGPTGDHACLKSDYVKTEIATAAASGALTIEVDSITGIANADVIGIELDDGTLQWTTVSGAPAGTTVTLAAALTDTVAVDNHVYAYTTIANRPLDIIEARVRYPSGIEVPFGDGGIISLSDYMSLSDKTSTGIANQLCYEPQTGNGKVRMWPACSDVQYVIPFTARMPIEDFDLATNDTDFPQEWFLPLSYNLAVLIAPKFGVKNIADVKDLAMYYKENAITFDEEHTSIYFGRR